MDDLPPLVDNPADTWPFFGPVGGGPSPFPPQGPTGFTPDWSNFSPLPQSQWPPTPAMMQAVPGPPPGATLFAAGPVPGMYPSPMVFNTGMPGMQQQGWPGHTPAAHFAQLGTPRQRRNSGINQFTTSSDGDWVHIGRNGSGGHDGFDDHVYGNGWEVGSNPRSLSRAGTLRPATPFSGTSSPSSFGTTLSRSRSRSRSKSFSHNFREHDKRPPRDWRPDFKMVRSPSLGSAIGSIGSKINESLVRRDSFSGAKIELHPYIRYSSAVAEMLYDLRDSPLTIVFRRLDRDINEWDLTRFACEPPQCRMTLCSQYFPWYIDVEATNPVGVTLKDLFSAIYVSMMQTISNDDFYNNEMDQGLRERIGQAWAARCGTDSEERARGVKRVDYLMERTVMEGLVKGRDGLWEMKVKRE